jgi:hypothetical protein
MPLWECLGVGSIGSVILGAFWVMFGRALGKVVGVPFYFLKPFGRVPMGAPKIHQTAPKPDNYGTCMGGPWPTVLGVPWGAQNNGGLGASWASQNEALRGGLGDPKGSPNEEVFWEGQKYATREGHGVPRIISRGAPWGAQNSDV